MRALRSSWSAFVSFMTLMASGSILHQALRTHDQITAAACTAPPPTSSVFSPFEEHPTYFSVSAQCMDVQNLTTYEGSTAWVASIGIGVGITSVPLLIALGMAYLCLGRYFRLRGASVIETRQDDFLRAAESVGLVAAVTVIAYILMPIMRVLAGLVI